jgi:hypothetical protein
VWDIWDRGGQDESAGVSGHVINSRRDHPASFSGKRFLIIVMNHF